MSMQLISISPQQQMSRELLFIFDKAHYLSSRAGWAWSLVRDGQRVSTGSGMFGYPAANLKIPAIGTCSQGALYLSSPPREGFITWDQLLPSLKASNIVEVNIPSIDEPLDSFHDCQSQLSAWGGKVFHHDVKGIGCQSGYGSYSLRTKKRPWVACITATSMGGVNVDLSNFYNEFGFKQRVINKIKGSHALITDRRIDCEMFKNIKNAAGCHLLVHEYHSIERLKIFLKELELLELSTVVAIVHHDICHKLLNLELIDEVSISYKLIDASSSVSSSFSELDFKDWKITDCSPLVSGINVEFINKPF